jgi:hypothetical protein
LTNLRDRHGLLGTEALRTIATASTLQSPALCWHLSPHVKGQLIWNSKVSDVARFFKQTIHGYTFLTSEATLKENAELDDSLSDGLVTYLKSAIVIVVSQIHLVQPAPIQSVFVSKTSPNF